jgi:hypothetical protein
MKEMELETLDPVNLKYIFIAGLSEDATRDQIEEAYFGSSSQETYNAYEIQNFSI